MTKEWHNIPLCYHFAFSSLHLIDFFSCLLFESGTRVSRFQFESRLAKESSRCRAIFAELRARFKSDIFVTKPETFFSKLPITKIYPLTKNNHKFRFFIFSLSFEAGLLFRIRRTAHTNDKDFLLDKHESVENMNDNSNSLDEHI